MGKMTPREVIRKNIRFENPDRIGIQFDRGRKNDFVKEVKIFPKRYEEKRWVEGQFEYYDDEWGNIWYRIIGGSKKGEIQKPVLEDWAALKDLKMPDYLGSGDFGNIKKQFEADGNMHYRMINLPGFPFSISRYLRKMEIYFQDLVLERENVDKLHDMVTSSMEKLIKKIPETGADGVIFFEDWGVQDRLLISPDMWRDIFKPLYKRLCDAAHSVNLDMLMHSCGYNWAIIDDLAEVGINAFQFDQPTLYGDEKLAERLQHHKICLYSPVDVQKILPTGNKKLIQDEARKMVKLFFGKNGGLIAKNYPDINGIGVTEEWDNWMYEAFLEYAK